MPALAMAPRVLAQGAPSLRVRALNHLTLSVSDVRRSLDFYQGLFGTPIQARQGGTPILRIGNGPQFLALGAAGPGMAPSINHFCMTVENFNVDAVMQALAARGITRVEQVTSGGGLGLGPLKSRVRMRGAEAGGAKEGTPELYFGDPDGVVVQLQDPTYCGGAGVLGNVCRSIEPPPSKGLLAVRDISHFTVFVSDSNRSTAFYRELFGLQIQAYQGPMPVLGFGRGVGFLAFAGAGPGRGGGAAPPRPARIDHACFSMEGFNPDRVLKALGEYGIKPRASGQGQAGPLTSYVTMRMPDRGGAPGGTPELYFTDPDGLLIQLQDLGYCGGGGYLGNECKG